MPHYTVNYQFYVQGIRSEGSAMLFAGDEQIARHLFELRHPWAKISLIDVYDPGSTSGVDEPQEYLVYGHRGNGRPLIEKVIAFDSAMALELVREANPTCRFSHVNLANPVVADIVPQIKKPWLTSTRFSWLFLVALAIAIFLASTFVHRCNAQDSAPRLYLPGYETPSFHWKPALWMGGIGFAAGASDGLNQMFLFHTDDADNIFGPGTNPDDTWRRKWKHGDPASGEAFPLSSTLLVFVTDPYHGTRTFTRWTALPQYSIHGYVTFQEFYGWRHRTKREKRNIICYNLARILFSEACRNIGFHSMYSVLPTIFND